MTPQRGALQWLFESISLLALLAVIGLLAANWSTLPNRVPTHFGIDGTADGWGPKESVFIGGGLSLLLYFLLSVFANKPHLANVPFSIDRNDPRVQQSLFEMTVALKAALMLTLLGVVFFTIETAYGRAGGLPPAALPTSLLLILAPTAYYLLQLKSLSRQI